MNIKMILQPFAEKHSYTTRHANKTIFQSAGLINVFPNHDENAKRNSPQNIAPTRQPANPHRHARPVLPRSTHSPKSDTRRRRPPEVARAPRRTMPPTIFISSSRESRAYIEERTEGPAAGSLTFSSLPEIRRPRISRRPAVSAAVNLARVQTLRGCRKSIAPRPPLLLLRRANRAPALRRVTITGRRGPDAFVITVGRAAGVLFPTGDEGWLGEGGNDAEGDEFVG